MSFNKTYKCLPIYEGSVSGEALVSSDAICFHLVEPETGVLIEEGHVLKGKSLAGKVLIVPSGKGSSSVQLAGLYEIVCNEKAPIGVIVKNPDPVLATALLVMEIPSVFNIEEPFFDEVREGQHISFSVNAESGMIKID